MDSTTGAPIKLNVGCGHRRVPGFLGVDIVPRPNVDIVAPADSIPLADGCAVEVMAIHVVEHFFSWEIPVILKEWARLLRPGGRLTLELPDAWKAARNLVNGTVRPGKHPDQLSMWALYGDDTLRDPYMMHKSGWWFARLSPFVLAAGFVEVVERETIWHPAGRGIRDFRLEAVKA